MNTALKLAKVIVLGNLSRKCMNGDGCVGQELLFCTFSLEQYISSSKAIKYIHLIHTVVRVYLVELP